MKPIPIIDTGFLVDSAKRDAMKNAEWYFRLSKNKQYSLATRRCFQSTMWIHLFYWAGYRE